MAIEFSEDQATAVDRIEQWRREWTLRDQWLTMGGYAGTGKTTIISHLSSQWPGVAVAAFCGKAANVLRTKGVPATTIHGLIYEPKDNGVEITFRKRQRLDGVNCIIIDEASMVNHQINEDLLSFKLPVLYVGDHGQLEPIGDNPNLMKDPQVRLERIHRQAQDNPILRLATAFRENREAPYWSDQKGRLKILPRGEFDANVSAGSQMIVGFNATRHRINAMVREQQKRQSKYPEPGELLICLKNNRIYNVFNGQQATVIQVGHQTPHKIHLTIGTEDGRRFLAPCLKKQFGADLVKEHRDNEVLLYDFGSALTAHKSQGSEFDNVVVLEEPCDRWDMARWRYTVATRAKERLIYCR